MHCAAAQQTLPAPGFSSAPRPVQHVDRTKPQAFVDGRLIGDSVATPKRIASRGQVGRSSHRRKKIRPSDRRGAHREA